MPRTDSRRISTTYVDFALSPFRVREGDGVEAATLVQMWPGRVLIIKGLRWIDFALLCRGAFFAGLVGAMGAQPKRPPVDSRQTAKIGPNPAKKWFASNPQSPCFNDL